MSYITHRKPERWATRTAPQNRGSKLYALRAYVY